jgi:hypothetical protein
VLVEAHVLWGLSLPRWIQRGTVTGLTEREREREREQARDMMRDGKVHVGRRQRA